MRRPGPALPCPAPPRSRQVKQWIAQTGAKRAAVVGGGFIGLEVGGCWWGVLVGGLVRGGRWVGGIASWHGPHLPSSINPV